MLVSQNTVTFRVELPQGLLDPEYLDPQGRIAVIANAVTGSMDIVSSAEMDTLERIRSNGAPDPGDAAIGRQLVDRGYVFETKADEERAYRSLVDGYFTTLRQAPFQFMMIPSFLCQLACPYCFEGDLTAKSPRMTDEMVDAAFDAMPLIQAAHENSGQPYVTLFGGEPLLDIPAQRRIVERILSQSYDQGYPVTAITNGVDLDAYAPMLARYECEEIQVSFDGTPQIHDRRRVFRGGKPTFNLIARSIDVALDAGLRVLIRLLVDHETIADLPSFAQYAERRGWIDNPQMRIFHGFTKQIDFLLVTPEHPPERREAMVRGDFTAGLQDAFYDMLRTNPLVDRMLRPDPWQLRSAVLSGDRVRPNLQGCSAGTSVIAFDPNGKIYGCPETVGRPQHACGSYLPEFEYRSAYRDPWRHRHVDTVPKCKDCNVKLFCGGGGCPIKGWAVSGGDFNTCYCPKEETVRTGVQKALAYLVPLALSAGGNPDPSTLGEEMTAWEALTRQGSFPWRS